MDRMSFSRLFRCWLRDLRFFGTFIPGNENAGGSAICIHRNFCLRMLLWHSGRDHVVRIQSGRQSPVIVNVHFEPELTLRRLRERLRLITPSRSLLWDVYVKDCVSSLHIGLRIPMLWASSSVISTSVNQKKEGLNFGTKPSPTVTRERLQCFIPFFRMFSRLLNLITQGGTPQPLGSYVLCQGLIASLWTYLWLRHKTFTPMFLRIWETGPFRVITRRYVSFKKPTDRGQQGQRIPSWMSKRPVFCSFLKRLHDDHRYSADPLLRTCRVQNYWWKRPKSRLFVSSHGRHLTAWEQSSSNRLHCIMWLQK